MEASKKKTAAAATATITRSKTWISDFQNLM